MSKRREAEETITEAYYDAESLCNKTGANYAMDRSLAHASRGEREHRALGRRMVGNVGRRSSVETCARLFFLRGFFAPVKSRSFEDRDDFLAAYGAAERAKRNDPNGYSKLCRRYRKAVRDLDYCDLVGE